MDLVRDARDRLAVAHIVQEDDELVAALPADRVRFAHAAFEAFDDFLEQGVADRVAERIVDRLEAVEVEEHQRHATLHAVRMRLRLGDAVAEQQAIGQAGQRVVVRQILDALLCLLALADVREDVDVVLRTIVGFLHHGNA